MKQHHRYMMKINKDTDLMGTDIRIEDDPFSTNVPWVIVVADVVDHDTLSMEIALRNLSRLFNEMANEVMQKRK